MKSFFTIVATVLILNSVGVSGSSAQSVQPQQSTTFTGQYYNLTRVGGKLLSDAGFASLSTINGFHITDLIGLGFGVGMDMETQDNGAVAFIPVFLDLRFEPLHGATRPTFFVEAGYSGNPGDLKYSTGLMASVGMGLFTPFIGSSSFSLDLTYNYQNSEANWYLPHEQLNSVGLNLGVLF